MPEPQMTNGNGRLNGLIKLTPGLVMMFANLIVLVVGLGIMWGTQVSRVDELKDRLNTAVARLEVYEKAFMEDRSMLTNRLTGLESDTKYISQTLAELKLALGRR